MAQLLIGLITAPRRLASIARSSSCKFTIFSNSSSTCKNVCSITTFNVFSRRSFFKFFKKPSVDHYKKIDNVPSHYTLIYRNTMERYAVAAHLVTFTVAAVVTIVIIIKRDLLDSHMDFSDWKEKTRKTDNEMGAYILSTLLLAVVIYSLVSKFPLRIYKVPKQPNYVFIMNAGIPTTRKKLESEIGNVKYIGKDGIVPWKDSLYRINNNKVVILIENFFKRPADLHIMLGEQKDPELEEYH